MEAETQRKSVRWGASSPQSNASTSTPGGKSTSNGSTPLLRYYAIADDTNHPEVREVMRLAVEGLPGWELDPIDQVTEQVGDSHIQTAWLIGFSNHN